MRIHHAQSFSHSLGVAVFQFLSFLIKQLKNKKITFVGNGILKYRDLLEKELDCNFEDNVLPKASDIAIFACENNINFKEPYEIIPVYLRKPQPER